MLPPSLHSFIFLHPRTWNYSHPDEPTRESITVSTAGYLLSDSWRAVGSWAYHGATLYSHFYSASSILLSISYFSLKLCICSSPTLSLFLPVLHSVIPTELFCTPALSEHPKSLYSISLLHGNFFFLTCPIRYCSSSSAPLLGAWSYRYATQ